MAGQPPGFGDREQQRAAGMLAGRVSFKLDDALHAKIVGLVQMGNYAQVACAASGVKERTYYRWLQVGRGVEEQIVAAVGEDHDLTHESSYQQVVTVVTDLHENDWRCWRLLQAVDKANAESEAYAVGIVRKHMPDQWTAAMTYLERRNPKRWKRRDLTEIAIAETEDQDKEEGLLESGASELVHEALREASREASQRVLNGGVVDSDATELPENAN